MITKSRFLNCEKEAGETVNPLPGALITSLPICQQRTHVSLWMMVTQTPHCSGDPASHPTSKPLFSEERRKAWGCPLRLC